MRRAVASTMAALLLAAHSPAAQSPLRKAYFAATGPGTFARYRMVDDKGAVTESVYARLADQGADRWIEMRSQVLTGEFKGPPSVMSYLVAGSFPLDQEGLDFVEGALRAVAQVGQDKPTELPRDTVKAIATSSRHYGRILVWKASETLEGRPVDHYTFTDKVNYMNVPATTYGDVWLSESVPFAVVRESAAIKDGAGQVLATYDQKLVESGAGARSGLTRWSWGGPAGRTADTPGRAADAPGPSADAAATPGTAVARLSGRVEGGGRLTLAEAFQQERVSIACLVPAGSGGARVRLTITNKSEAPLLLALTRAPMRLAVGTPIETLVLAAADDQELSIPPGEDAEPVEVAQIGRRVTAGRFTISRDQGTPRFQGSAEVGAGR